MNKILIFGTGLVVGGVVGYLITKRYCDKKKDEAIDAVVEDFKANYRPSVGVPGGEAGVEINPVGDDGNADNGIARDLLNATTSIGDRPSNVERVQYYKQSEIYKKPNYEDVLASLEGRQAEDVLAENESPSEESFEDIVDEDIHIINLDEYKDDSDGYAQASLLWYVEDDTLTDIENNVIYDRFPIVGDALEHVDTRDLPAGAVVFVINKGFEAKYSIEMISAAFEDMTA